MSLLDQWSPALAGEGLLFTDEDLQRLRVQAREEAGLQADGRALADQTHPLSYNVRARMLLLVAGGLAALRDERSVISIPALQSWVAVLAARTLKLSYHAEAFNRDVREFLHDMIADQWRLRLQSLLSERDRETLEEEVRVYALDLKYRVDDPELFVQFYIRRYVGEHVRLANAMYDDEEWELGSPESEID